MFGGVVRNCFGPALRLRSEQCGFFNPPHRGVVRAVSTPSTRAQTVGELAWLQAHVTDDGMHLLIEHAHHFAIPAHPQLATDVLRRNLVVSPCDFDVAIAVDFAPGLLKAGEEALRKWLERGLFVLAKMGIDLLARGAVDAPVGHVFLPFLKQHILLACST